MALLISVERRRWLTLSGALQPILREATEEIRAEMRRGDAAAAFALEGLALLSIARLARTESRSPEPPWLGDAALMIEQRFAEPLSLGRIATEIGVSRSVLARAFREHRSASVGETIRRVRVARAREALRKTRTPLAEIAIASGFHDQAHLTRVFRELTGQTPARYRSQSSKCVSARKS